MKPSRGEARREGERSAAGWRSGPEDGGDGPLTRALGPLSEERDGTEESEAGEKGAQAPRLDFRPQLVPKKLDTWDVSPSREAANSERKEQGEGFAQMSTLCSAT